MKLNKPTPGIYKIVNTKTGAIYIGESVNVIGRLATHFDQLKNDKHTNLAMQHDCDIHGLDSFEYELLEKTKPKKRVLRRLEEKYIAEYLREGKTLYNGKNEGFLHVKRRREKRKNEKRTEKRLLEENKRALHEKNQLLKSSGNVQRKSNNYLESDQSKSNAVVTGSGNGTAGTNGKSTTERPKTQGLDENGQSEKSRENIEKPLSKCGSEDHRIEILEGMIHHWPPKIDNLIYLICVHLDYDDRLLIHEEISPNNFNFFFSSSDERKQFENIIGIHGSLEKWLIDISQKLD